MKRKLKVILLVISCLLLFGCGNTGVSQEEYDRVVAEKEALEKNVNNSDNDRKDTESKNVTDKKVEMVSDDEDLHNKIELISEYFYIRNEENPRYFLIMKNNSEETVEIKANAVAKDKDGQLLGAVESKQNAISSGQEFILDFYFDEAGNVETFEYDFHVEKSKYSASYYEDIETETSVNGKKIIIMITNNGDKTVENVEPYVLFFKDEEVFSHEYSSYLEIKAGETIPVELECFDGEFEDFQLYVSAWGSAIGGTKTADEANEDKLEKESAIEKESTSKNGNSEKSKTDKKETKDTVPEKKSENLPAESKAEVSTVVTLGQKNALKTAKSYLDYSSFSHKGLVEQLEYEKYSKEEATYAADNCGADWNEQAVKTAKTYLEYSSFSKDGLIEQLEYEGFTKEQAAYGAAQNGY